MWGTQPALTTELNRQFKDPYVIDAEFFPPILVRAWNALVLASSEQA